MVTRSVNLRISNSLKRDSECSSGFEIAIGLSICAEAYHQASDMR